MGVSVGVEVGGTMVTTSCAGVGVENAAGEAAHAVKKSDKVIIRFIGQLY